MKSLQRYTCVGLYYDDPTGILAISSGPKYLYRASYNSLLHILDDIRDTTCLISGYHVMPSVVRYHVP